MGECDTHRINASVEGQNWGSTLRISTLSTRIVNILGSFWNPENTEEKWKDNKFWRKIKNRFMMIMLVNVVLLFMVFAVCVLVLYMIVKLLF